MAYRNFNGPYGGGGGAYAAPYGGGYGGYPPQDRYAPPGAPAAGGYGYSPNRQPNNRRNFYDDPEDLAVEAAVRSGGRGERGERKSKGKAKSGGAQEPDLSLMSHEELVAELKRMRKKVNRLPVMYSDKPRKEIKRVKPEIVIVFEGEDEREIVAQHERESSRRNNKGSGRSSRGGDVDTDVEEDIDADTRSSSKRSGSSRRKRGEGSGRSGSSRRSSRSNRTRSGETIPGPRAPNPSGGAVGLPSNGPGTVPAVVGHAPAAYGATPGAVGPGQVPPGGHAQGTYIAQPPLQAGVGVNANAGVAAPQEKPKLGPGVQTQSNGMVQITTQKGVPPMTQDMADQLAALNRQRALEMNGGPGRAPTSTPAPSGAPPGSGTRIGSGSTTGTGRGPVRSGSALPPPPRATAAYPPSFSRSPAVAASLNSGLPGQPGYIPPGVTVPKPLVLQQPPPQQQQQQQPHTPQQRGSPSRSGHSPHSSGGSHRHRGSASASMSASGGGSRGGGGGGGVSGEASSGRGSSGHHRSSSGHRRHRH